MSTFWLVVKAMLALLPLVVQLVRDGRVREASQRELIAALKEKFDARIDAARAARDEPHDDGVPDPYDRANRR